MLSRLHSFVTLSNTDNSNIHKANILIEFKDDAEVCTLLNYTYDTFKQYGISSKNCKKRSDLVCSITQYNNIITLLDDLNSGKIRGHSAIKAYNRFVEDNREHEELLWNIIDRNLKTRSTASMINKVIPGLIPTFDVALAQTYNDKTKSKIDWSAGYFVSRKLDGTRCLCIIDKHGGIKFYSRAGNEFKTLGKLRTELSKLNLSNVVLDGEVCVMDENGNEDFQGVIKQIKRKDFTMPNPKFVIFDMMLLDTFNAKEGSTKLSNRLDHLVEYVGEKTKSENIIVLEQNLVAGEKTLQVYIDEAIENGWEGVMLRKNVGYEGKRTKNLLKVKKFYDAEFTVIDIEFDKNRVIVDSKEVEEMMLRNVIIEYKGNRVGVGSGFSHEQRRKYYERPEDIMGKTITVCYFETTMNQNGTESLRFPTFKAVYENGRTT